MAKRRVPLGVARLPPSDCQFIEDQLSEVFFELSARGVSFKRALLGIYLTGVDDAKGTLLENACLPSDS